MEELRRESILLGYSPQISFGNPASSSPRVSDGNSDIDFNDVFGGPPRRRSSICDGRYSLNETDSFPTTQDGEPVSSRNLWSGVSEKPVFGEEPVYARRHPGDGFFDDIFKSEESGASTPKRHDREPFSPMSSSLVLSPVRPLPPNAETFESPSLTAKFSLPARVARGIDFSSLGSATHSRANHSYSPLPTSSSLSSQAPADAKHNIPSFYQSSLSPESNQNREEPSLQGKTDGTNAGSNLGKVLKNGEDSTNQGQFPFHFSIYKWANKEVSFTMPPTRGHVSRLKQTAKPRRCSSSNGRMGSEMNAMQSPTPSLSNSERPSGDHPLTSTDSFKFRPEKEERDSSSEETNQQSKKRPQTIEEQMLSKPQPEKTSSHHKTADRSLLHHSRREAKYAGGFGSEDSNQNKQKPSQIIEEPILSKSESKKASIVQETVDCAPLKHSKSEEQVNSFIDIGVSEKTEKELPEFMKFGVKHESRSARAVDDNKPKGAKETLTLDDGSEIKAKINRRSPLSLDSNKISKKDDGEATMVRKTEVGKSSSQSSSSNPGLGADGRRVGKVKEFVKIFNQDLSSTAKADVDNHSPSPNKQKHRANFGATIEVRADARTDLKVPLQNLNNTVEHVSVKVDELSKQSPMEQQPEAKTDSHRNNTQRSEQNSPAGTGKRLLRKYSIPEDSNFTLVDIDETFQENFLIKELPPDEIKQPQMQNDREEFKAIDDKIRQWSRGKEGNIRSLLSTLQYVLWPQSGWKPVPLVDIIDGNAVKRSYQRALLCLHPDKLQQRGGTSQQKYTAEKVFVILQEAWNLFSSLGLP